METLEQHLINRGMDISKYPIYYDHEERIITFMLYNLSGQVVGYQQYRPEVESKKKRNDPKEGRYFTYLKNDVDGLFGLELLNEDDPMIYIVEGAFKAAVLHRLGYNAIAVLTSTPKRLKTWFRIMRQTWDVVAIGDNDDAGKKLVNIVGRGFQSPKDLDEMSDSEIKQLLSLSE